MHIQPQILEKYFLAPELFNESEKDTIDAHLANCILCEKLFNTYKQINENIEEEIEYSPNDIDLEIAKRLYNEKNDINNSNLLVSNNSVQIFGGKAKIVERPNLFSLSGIVYVFKYYPLQSAGMTLITALAVAFLVFTVNNLRKDKNPVTLKFENSILSTYNIEGELLWKKNVDGIPNYNLDSLANWNYSDKRHINILDIDGDGKNEILLTGRYENKGLFRTDSLYCINNDSSIRWIISPENQKFNYAPSWKRTHWEVTEFFTIKTNNGPKLFVYAHVASFGGTVISEINPKNGNIVSSIYHSGYSTAQYHCDIDGDGNEEIIMGGTSSFDRPFILVLSSNHLMGALPDYYTKEKHIKGNALYYILLPVSELGKLLANNSGSNVRNLYKFNNNGIAVLVKDVAWSSKEEITLQYTFDSTLTCKTVTAGTSYGIYYDKYYKQGLIKSKLDAEYFNSLKDSILYWDGDNFVPTPCKNKYSSQKFRLP